MHATIKKVLSDSGSNEEAVYLIIHDWGSFLGMLYQNKYHQSVKKVVALDVGLGLTKNIREIGVLLFYQLWFAIAYVISQAINYQLGNLFFKLFLFLPFIKYISPTPHDTLHRPISEISVHLCYPYYHLWKGLLFDKVRLRPPRFPSCPVLYLYGLKKNAMFHSSGFIDRLAATEGCKSLALEAGHWVTHFQPEIVVKEVKEFFSH